MVRFNVEEMQAQFHQLGRKREAILAKSGPLREQRDKIRNEAQAKVKTLNDQIKEIEKDLYDTDRERGMIARALKGQTGAPPA